MMDAFTAMLEARDPALGRFRAYRLEAGNGFRLRWMSTYGCSILHRYAVLLICIRI
jgi:hypothetical protein